MSVLVLAAPRPPRRPQLVLFALAAIALGVACGPLLALVSCKPPEPVVQSAENVAAVAQYEALLADCRKEGRRTRSYEAYEACAAEVDRHLCEQHRVMCPDGGR